MALSGHIAVYTMLHACRIWNKVSSGLQKAFSHRTIRSVMHQDITPGNMQKRFVPLYNSNNGTVRPYCGIHYVSRMPNLEQGQFRSPKSLQSQNHQVCDASRHHSRKHAKALCATLQQQQWHCQTILRYTLCCRHAESGTRSVQVSAKPSVTEPSGP